MRRYGTGVAVLLLLLAGCGSKSTTWGNVDHCTGPDAAAQPDGDWVSIAGGAFQMGSADDIPGWDHDADEQPRHEVEVQDFEIWRTEITVAQYARCYCAGACEAPFMPLHDDDDGDNGRVPQRDDHPMNGTTWWHAFEFCAWLGARLPTEAEWEFAATSRGRSGDYPWGDEEPSCELAVMYDGGWGCGEGHTSEVCSKPAGNTEQGLCDMAGNESEWVQDWYHDCYDCSLCPYGSTGSVYCDHSTAAPADGSAWEIPATTNRTVRGGAFHVTDLQLRVTHRGAGGTSSTLGFRCAR